MDDASRHEKHGVPEGEIAMRSDPRILKARPALVSRTRPSRSARLPATTMKIPENRAVMLTAMLFTLSLIHNQGLRP